MTASVGPPLRQERKRCIQLEYRATQWSTSVSEVDNTGPEQLTTEK